MVLRHMPAMQAWPAEQAVPHVPQFDASVCVSTQLVPQRVWPAMHAA